MGQELVKPAILVIRERWRKKLNRERKQLPLLNTSDGWHDQIADRLRFRLESTQFANFEKCGHEQLFRTCKCCGSVQSFEYHCNIKWCPRCNYRITARRRDTLGAWTKLIQQPKHLVTTCRNFPILTRKKLRTFQKALAKLRRLAVFDQVKGGCVSIETTNEGNGWHVHAHWLLDARWVDAGELAVVWGKLVGQEFGIVKIIDARETEYLQEVTKYCVKGSDMAKWPAEHILEFVLAVKGLRNFFVFGSLFKQQAAIRRQLNLARNSGTQCECGSAQFLWEDERAVVLNQIRREKRR